MQDPGIIRNRKKVESVVNNAGCFQQVQAEFGSFDAYVWAYVDGIGIANKFISSAQVPAQTEISVKLAKDLKKRGFKFVGPIGMYAFMQSIGMVQDHLTSCHCHQEANS